MPLYWFDPNVKTTNIIKGESRAIPVLRVYPDSNNQTPDQQNTHVTPRRLSVMGFNIENKYSKKGIWEISYMVCNAHESLKEFSYIHSYFPGVSANFIQQYIIKVINWFKSWKVHLLGINTLYKFGNIYENLVKILENLNIDTDFDNIIDKVYIHDLIDNINVSDNIGDNVTIRDRIRIISLLNDRIEYHDDNTSLSLLLNGNDISVVIKDGNIISIKSSNAGFNTSDNNMIVQRTDIKSDQLFAQQVIDSINLYTGDYMDWRILNE